MSILVEASSRLLGLLGCRMALTELGILALCKQRSGSRSDTLQTIPGLGSQQVDSDGCLEAEEACAFYSAVASPESLKVSSTIKTCLVRYWMQQAWKLYCRNKVAACHPSQALQQPCLPHIWCQSQSAKPDAHLIQLAWKWEGNHPKQQQS